MIPRPARPTPKTPGKPVLPASETGFRGEAARYWGYLMITRAGLFERHMRHCPECREVRDGVPDSAWCDQAWTLAENADEASGQLEQLLEYAAPASDPWDSARVAV